MIEWIKHIEFLYPKMLTLLAFLPFMIWWYVKKNNRAQATFTVSTSRAFTFTGFKTVARHLPFILRLLATGCIIVALARPQTHQDERMSKGEGIDIILGLDVSGSMLTKDFLPNRLEVAKEVARQFILDRPIDRIGLVIFSGESYTLSPLTSDKNTLLEQINGISSGMLPDGTLIGEGLATSVDRLSKSNAKSKVVILLTDGKEQATESRIIDPITALEIAKSKGVKVYTIGMSAANTVSIEENIRGKRTVLTTATLDEELLRRIATETGGQYFRAREKTGLEKIYEQIDRLEKSKVEVQSLRHYREEFLLFVLAALALLFIEFILRSTVFRKFP